MLGLDRVEFLQGDGSHPWPDGRFDIIASNPPYVAEGDAALQDAALQHEPQMALASGPDGMACASGRSCVRRLIIWSADGWLLLEHGCDQAAAVARELVARGFGHVRSHRDLAGHERMTEAQCGG